MSNYKFTIPKITSTQDYIPKNSNNNSIKNIAIDFGLPHILFIIIIIFVIILIIKLLYYIIVSCYDKKTIINYLFDLDFEPCKGEPTSYLRREIEDEKEVFHIANQDYTYEQAKCKCAAYGARLATKDEIIEAYNKGADWCTYGWSQGQRAYYPTQKCTWDKLQEKQGHQYDCGFAGVNGGFFANPKLKFGINCYGIRPKGRVVKEKAPVCDTKDFCQMRSNFGAAHKLDTDTLAPFNSNQWSQFD